jgi:hypothetical protein
MSIKPKGLGFLMVGMMKKYDREIVGIDTTTFKEVKKEN